MDVQNLYYYRSDKEPILENINFTIYPGTINYIIGESNSGKSLLIKCIAGHLPYDGVVLWNQKKISKKMSYMGQKINVFESLTVLDTIQFYHQLYCPKKYSKDFYMKYLKPFFLTEVIDSIVGKISDCYKRILILSCHLLINHPIILLDEPLIEYDNEISFTIFNIVRNHVKNNDNICIITMPPSSTKHIKQGDNIYVLNNKTLILENKIFWLNYSNHEYIEIKINDDENNQNIQDDKKTCDCGKKLLYREMILIIRNKFEILKRFLIIIMFTLFQTSILGPMSIIINKNMYTHNIFMQFSIFMHLIIIFFTSSMLPILFIVPFFTSQSIIENEINEGWYDSVTIYAIKYILEISRTLILGSIYNFFICLPIIRTQNNFYWILNINILILMLFTTIQILNFSCIFKNMHKTLGCTLFYNIFSFSLNMGFLIFFKNRFTSFLQFLSIQHLQTNSILMYLNHNHSYVWIINRLNILPNIFKNHYEPVLLSLGYFFSLSVFYFLMIWIKNNIR